MRTAALCSHCLSVLLFIVLELLPKDADVYKCKIVAQLQHGDFKGALDTLDKAPAELAAQMVFERVRQNLLLIFDFAMFFCSVFSHLLQNTRRRMLCTVSSSTHKRLMC